MANETYLNDIDKEKMSTLMQETDKNVEYFNSVCVETAKKYTKHLDAIMEKLYKKIAKSNDITTDELEQNILELTNLIYFMGDKLESLGIYDDMSNAAAKEVYNKTYIESQVISSDEKKKITVAELTARSEQASQYETVVNAVYEHAYRMVKFKIDAANKMIDVLRKIISRRMQEEMLSSYAQPPLTDDIIKGEN